eukprot:scaffold83166_cov60-Phaeocystis_antarctica.AAC.5
MSVGGWPPRPAEGARKMLREGAEAGAARRVARARREGRQGPTGSGAAAPVRAASGMSPHATSAPHDMQVQPSVPEHDAAGSSSPPGARLSIQSRMSTLDPESGMKLVSSLWPSALFQSRSIVVPDSSVSGSLPAKETSDTCGPSSVPSRPMFSMNSLRKVLNSTNVSRREYERSRTSTKSCLALQIFVSARSSGQSSFSTATPRMAAGRSSSLRTPRILCAK